MLFLDAHRAMPIILQKRYLLAKEILEAMIS
jgi:hypothetical protein